MSLATLPLHRKKMVIHLIEVPLHLGSSPEEISGSKNIVSKGFFRSQD
jgi:hypothetical protein